MKGTDDMDYSIKKWLGNALADYDRVVFLYQLSQESCAELKKILRDEKRKLLLLTDAEAPDFPCDQRRMHEEECRCLLELYFSYSFADNFIFLTDQKNFPWPSIANFMEAGLAARGEALEAMLR